MVIPAPLATMSPAERERFVETFNALRPYSPEKPPIRALCNGCGRPYGEEHGFPDLVVSHDAWAKISEKIIPAGVQDGLLCPSCMCALAYRAGLANVRAVFRSGPFCEDAPSPLPPGEEVEKLLHRVIRNVQRFGDADSYWEAVREIRDVIASLRRARDEWIAEHELDAQVIAALTARAETAERARDEAIAAADIVRQSNAALIAEHDTLTKEWDEARASLAEVSTYAAQLERDITELESRLAARDADRRSFFDAFTAKPCEICGGKRNCQVDGQLQVICFYCAIPADQLAARLATLAARSSPAEP